MAPRHFLFAAPFQDPRWFATEFSDDPLQAWRDCWDLRGAAILPGWQFFFNSRPPGRCRSQANKSGTCLSPLRRRDPGESSTQFAEPNPGRSR